MTKTIFVGHTPGTFKAYWGLADNDKIGWKIMFLDEKGTTSYPEPHVYKHRSNAYRRTKQLNDMLQEQEANEMA